MTAPRSSPFATLRAFLTRDVGELFDAPRRIDAALAAELETRLIAGDVGVASAKALVAALRQAAGDAMQDAKAVRQLLAHEVAIRLAPFAVPLAADRAQHPYVVLVVGVNGAGKTTTIAKLAERARAEGLTVVLAAGDTFRAAALEQLATWGERVGAQVVSQGMGSDPAAVAHDALLSAKARGADLLIVDTAGRLHTQQGLMDELKKVQRVLAKLQPGAPHEVLLVLDGSQGQNALVQARAFHAALGVTGLVVTKLDGSAKGGVLLAIVAELGIPVRALGMGETAADLVDLEPAEFAAALVGAAA
jgi:fused signal recognition particle receptor